MCVNAECEVARHQRQQHHHHRHYGHRRHPHHRHHRQHAHAHTHAQVQAHRRAHDGNGDGDASERARHKAALTLHSVCVSVPHPDKREKYGEDSCFLLDVGLGVFDGVGGWIDLGVDSGAYSKQLAAAAKDIILQRMHASTSTSTSTSTHARARARARASLPSAKAVLTQAVGRATVAGSSTAVLAVLHGDALDVCNVGDGALVVIRNGALLFATVEQQHAFNFPYQLGFDDRVDLLTAEVSNVSLKVGDVILAATDGLWDNVEMDDVISIVQRHTARWPTLSSALPPSPARCASAPARARARLSAPVGGGVGSGRGSGSGSGRDGGMSTDGGASHSHKLGNASALEAAAFAVKLHKRVVNGERGFDHGLLKALAFDIAARACRAAHQETGDSPFARKARSCGLDFEGGKQDDITVVATVVLDTRSGFQNVFHTACCDTSSSSLSLSLASSSSPSPSPSSSSSSSSVTPPNPSVGAAPATAAAQPHPHYQR